MKTKRVAREVLEYTVTAHRADEGGFWVEVPALTGCFAQGESLEDALENAKGAIESHLEALRNEGSGIPQDRDIVIGRVSVFAPV